MTAIGPATPLKQILEAEGRKQRWLATTTGIPEHLVSLIVRGLRPSAEHAQLIADALGRDVDELWPAVAA